MSGGRIVHLLRHGPVAVPGRMLGHRDDPPLIADCPVMAARLHGLTIRSCVSSDLSRAAVQAGHLARLREVSLRLDPRWRELDFGDWDGLSPSGIAPAALSAFWDDPDVAPPPRGERWSGLCARVREALGALKDGALVITHAGAMRAALAVLTGLDHRTVWALDLPYRARLSLRIWPGLPASGQVVALDTGQAA